MNGIFTRLRDSWDFKGEFRQWVPAFLFTLVSLCSLLLFSCDSLKVSLPLRSICFSSILLVAYSDKEEDIHKNGLKVSIATLPSFSHFPSLPRSFPPCCLAHSLLHPSFPLSLFFFLKMYLFDVYECVSVCMHEHHLGSWCPQRLKWEVRSPGTGVTDGCDLLYGC